MADVRNNIETPIKNEYIDILDEYGSTRPNKIKKLIPISGSKQENNSGEYVGQVCYSPSHNEFVYHIERTESGIIQVVDGGGGVSINLDILNTIKDKYNVKYVFLKMRENEDVYQYHISSFSKEFEYSTCPQRHAQRESDAIEIYKGAGEQIIPKKYFSKDCRDQLSFDEAKQKYLSNK